MKIKHEQWGEVEGVMKGDSSADWTKDGACYYFCDGWREVKEKRWVDVTSDVEMTQGGRMIKVRQGTDEHYFSVDHHEYSANASCRFRKVSVYDLPDSAYEGLGPGSYVDWKKFLGRYKKDCLIVERELTL